MPPVHEDGRLHRHGEPREQETQGLQGVPERHQEPEGSSLGVAAVERIPVGSGVHGGGTAAAQRFENIRDAHHSRHHTVARTAANKAYGERSRRQGRLPADRRDIQQVRAEPEREEPQHGAALREDMDLRQRHRQQLRRRGEGAQRRVQGTRTDGGDTFHHKHRNRRADGGKGRQGGD